MTTKTSSEKADKTKLAKILANVTVGNPNAPWRVLIYGFKGVGKSTFAAQCPDCIVIPIEEGVNQLRVKQTPQVKSWSELHDTLDALLLGEHSYKAVVLDGIDSAEALVVEHIESELAANKRAYTLKSGKKAKTFSEMNEEFGGGYVAVVDEWRSVVKKLDKLRSERMMRVLLVGHAKATRIENLEGKDYDRWELKALGKGTSALLTDWADYVLFARREANTMDMNKGKKVIGITGDHVIQCRGTAAYDAKTRGDIQFPEKLPLNWEQFESTAQLIVEWGRDLPGELQKRFDAEVSRFTDESRREKASAIFKDAADRCDYAMQGACIVLAKQVNANGSTQIQIPSHVTNTDTDTDSEAQKATHTN